MAHLLDPVLPLLLAGGAPFYLLRRVFEMRLFLHRLARG